MTKAQWAQTLIIIGAVLIISRKPLPGDEWVGWALVIWGNVLAVKPTVCAICGATKPSQWAGIMRPADEWHKDGCSEKKLPPI